MGEPRPRGAFNRFWHAEGKTAWVRDGLVAGLAVFIVIGSIFAYSSTWPPMVVIESGSMMHANDRSMIGVIDTGDLTLVKKVDSRDDIVTYFQGERTGHTTYGSFGDVIIYAKNGHREITPIIHRAMCWLEFNRSGPPLSATAPDGVVNSTWDVPELGLYGIEVLATSVEGSPAHPHAIITVGAVRTWNAGSETAMNLSIDLTRAVQAMGAHLHSGFITKGDHNQAQDEAVPPWLPGGLTGPPPVWDDPHGARDVPVQPVLVEWVVGRSEGELPWFGVIKLYAGGTPMSTIPGNSQMNLVIAIIVIGAGPWAFEKAWGRWGHHVTDRIPQRTKDKWHGSWDRLPGGQGRAERRRERLEELEGERKKTGGRRHGGRR